MIDKLEETDHDNEAESLFSKTPELNKPKTYVSTHNRFNTYMVLISRDLNKAEIQKMLHRDSPHHKIEILMSFNFLNLFKPNEKTEIIALENQTIKFFFPKLKIKTILM